MQPQDLCECGEPKNSIGPSPAATSGVDLHEFKPSGRPPKKPEPRKFIVIPFKRGMSFVRFLSIAVLLLSIGVARTQVPVARTTSPWVLVCNHHGTQENETFLDESAAIRWIESHRAYAAVELMHDKVIRPCHTREDDGSSAHSRLVVCVAQEEFDKSFDVDFAGRGNTY
jgi:hypothetical protein